WVRAGGGGKGFGSNAAFRLPDGSLRSPDLAWIADAEKLEFLPPDQQKGFAKLVPDFVAEIRSPSDPRPTLEAKMEMWVSHGVRLAWLIDPHQKQVLVYRLGSSTAETLESPKVLTGEDVLPG